MNSVRFAKPSFERVLWSIIAVAAACCVIAGVLLYSVAIATHSDVETLPKGEYVRLLILDLTLWGPVLLLTLWKFTLPLVVGLGWLAAALRRAAPPPPQKQD